MTEILEGQVSMFDQDLLSGKTFLEPSVVTKEQTSNLCFRRLPISAKGTALYLWLHKDGGNPPVSSWETVGALPGESMMHNFGAWPSEEKECTLSQILDLNAPEKYCLSRKACAGILRRAEKRGKVLPDMLLDALMEVVGSGG